MNVNVLRNRRKPALAHNIDIPAQHLACRVCATRAPSPSPSRVRSDISALAQLVHRSLSVTSPCCRARFELDVCLLRQKQEQGSVGPVPTSRVHCIIHKAFSLSHSRGTSQARATSPCHNACCIFQWRSNFVSGVSPLSIFAQQSRYPPRLTLYLFSGLRREPDEDRLLQ